MAVIVAGASSIATLGCGGDDSSMGSTLYWSVGGEGGHSIPETPDERNDSGYLLHGSGRYYCVDALNESYTQGVFHLAVTDFIEDPGYVPCCHGTWDYDKSLGLLALTGDNGDEKRITVAQADEQHFYFYALEKTGFWDCYGGTYEIIPDGSYQIIKNEQLLGQ